MAAQTVLDKSHLCAGREDAEIVLTNWWCSRCICWGVMDRLLEEERLHIEGISGTSAGSMNAVVLAYGMLNGGREGAKQKLHEFWYKLSQAGLVFNPCRQTPLERFFYGRNMDDSLSYKFFEAITRWFSPYQLNPFDINPLRDVLLSTIDFEHLQTCVNKFYFCD